MTKKFITLTLVLCLVLCMALPVCAATYAPIGDGTADAPYQIIAGADSAAITVPADGSVYCKAAAGSVDMLLSITYPNGYILLNEDYIHPNPITGIAELKVPAGEEVLFQVVSANAESSTSAAISFAELVYGTMSYPIALTEVGAYTTEIAAGASEGVYYTWTASVDGKLSLTINGTSPDATGWQYQISNTTAGIYKDTHWSDDETVAFSESVDVSAGDEVTFWISTYDPADAWTLPAGSVNFELSLICAGSEQNPIQITESITNVEVPAGDAGTWVSIETPGGAKVAFRNPAIAVIAQDGTVQQPDLTNVVLIELEPGKYVYHLVNTGSETGYTQVILAQAGSVNYPVVIQAGDHHKHTDAYVADMGTHYAWTAPADGTFTFTVSEDSSAWQYQITIGSVQTDPYMSADDDVVYTYTAEVKEGDIVTILLTAYPGQDFPMYEGDIDFTVTFIEKTDEPEQPVEPTEPEQPTEPSEPEQSTEPSVPGETTEPSEPEQPTEPSVPEQSTEPSEPEQPTEPSKPEQPTEPSKPEQPTEPSVPEESTEPSEPEQPDNNPPTGDMNIAALAVAMMSAAVGLAVSVRKKSA